MASILTDIRLSLRRLSRAPGFTLFALASLALGIGVTTAIYSAVRTLLWMPLGVPAERSLAAVTAHGARWRPMSWVDYEDFRAQPTVALSTAASTSIKTALHAETVSRTVFGEAVSGNYFATLALTPRLGRLLGPDDERSAARAAVLSELFWRRDLNGNPSILGRTIDLAGVPFEVVGIVAGSFHGLDALVPGAVWIPATAIRDVPQRFDLTEAAYRQRAGRAFAVWARLRSPADLTRFASETALIGQRFDAAYPAAISRMPSLSSVPAREWSAADGTQDATGAEGGRSIVVMFMMALAVVLLIACTNLANLSLARGTARAEETAVRSALGASRWRLVREQIIESVLIVAAGGVGAAVVLRRLTDWMTTDLPLRPSMTIAFRPSLDGTVAAAALGAALVAVLVFGVWPAVTSTGLDVRLRLGGGNAATPPRWRFHRNLIAWQVCGSVALLLVAVMSARIVIGTNDALRRPHYDQLAIAQLDLRLNGVEDARAHLLIDELVAAARRQPGLVSVSVGNGPPSMLFGTPAVIGTPDDPTGARSRNTLTALSAIMPGFLETLREPVVRGRSFTNDDSAASPRVTIISEQLARDVFRTTDVVGRQLRVGTSLDPRAALEATTIVGVARDLVTVGSIHPDRLVFVPLAQHYDGRAPVMLLARAAGGTPAAVSALRAAIRQVDPSLAVSAAGTADVLLDGPMFLVRVVALLAASLGGLALVLAMAGLFGVLSHVVERRRREIGVRLAMGADRHAIVRMVLRDGLRPVGKGLTLGLLIGLGVRIAIRGQVFTTIAAWDPVEFTALPALFVCAALVACWLPAFRASRVDPNVALRDL